MNYEAQLREKGYEGEMTVEAIKEACKGYLWKVDRKESGNDFFLYAPIRDPKPPRPKMHSLGYFKTDIDAAAAFFLYLKEHQFI